MAKIEIAESATTSAFLRQEAGEAISRGTTAEFATDSGEAVTLFSVMKSCVDPEWRNPSGQWNGDDTAKVQAAIQEAADEGRTLKLRKSYTTSALYLLPGTRIEGDANHAAWDSKNSGAGFRRKRNDTAGFHLSLYDQTDQTAWNGKGVELYNFALYGDKGYQISGNACGGLSVSHTGGAGGGSFIPRHKVRGLEITGCHGTGLEIGNFTRDSSFDDLAIYGSDGYGVYDEGVDGSRSNWNVGQSFCDGVRSIASAVRYENIKAWGSGQYNLASVVSPVITDAVTAAAFDAVNAANFFFWKCIGVTAVNLKSQEAANSGFRLEGQGPSYLTAFIGIGFESDGDCRMNSVSGTRAGINIFRAPGITLDAFVGKLNASFVGGPNYGVNIGTNSEGGRISLTTSGITSFPISIGSGGGNNDFSVNGHKDRVEAINYASTITPSWQNGRIKTITLTGNPTIAAPYQAATGQEMTFIFTQDATGGRTVTWNSIFKVNWTPVTTGGAKNAITFVYDGTNWVQKSVAVGL